MNIKSLIMTWYQSCYYLIEVQMHAISTGFYFHNTLILNNFWSNSLERFAKFLFGAFIL